MVNLALTYLGETWAAIRFFASPTYIGGAAVVLLLFLLLRVYFGGFFGWLLRYVAYGGLFWGLITRQPYRDHFPPAPAFEYKLGLIPAARKMAEVVQSGQYALTAYIVAGILVVGVWLVIATVGGIWRARRRGRRYAGYAGAPAGAEASAGGGGQPFNVTLRESEKKQTMVIMMTDIKGYSARMEKDEAATFAHPQGAQRHHAARHHHQSRARDQDHRRRLHGGVQQPDRRGPLRHGDAEGPVRLQ